MLHRGGHGGGATLDGGGPLALYGEGAFRLPAPVGSGDRAVFRVALALGQLKFIGVDALRRVARKSPLIRQLPRGAVPHGDGALDIDGQVLAVFLGLVQAHDEALGIGHFLQFGTEGRVHAAAQHLRNQRRQLRALLGGQARDAAPARGGDILDLVVGLLLLGVGQNGVGQRLVAALDLLNGQQRVKFRFAIFRPHQQVQRRFVADQRAVGQERGGQRGALPRLVLVEVHHALAVHAKSKRAFGPCVRLGRGHADMLQHAVHHRQRFLAVGQERPHLQGKAVAQIAVRIQIACKRFIQARDTRTRAAKRQHQRE